VPLAFQCYQNYEFFQNFENTDKDHLGFEDDWKEWQEQKI